MHVVRKLEGYLACTLDNPGYFSSFKRAFASYMDLNIVLPPVLKACAFVDPRLRNLKGINYYVF